MTLPHSRRYRARLSVLPMYLFIYLYFYLFIHLSLHLFIHLSLHLLTPLFICPFFFITPLSSPYPSPPFPLRSSFYPLTLAEISKRNNLQVHVRLKIDVLTEHKALQTLRHSQNIFSQRVSKGCAPIVTMLSGAFSSK